MRRSGPKKTSGTVKFIQHLTTLVVNEWECDKKTNQGMMRGTSLNLEKRGVAILNLKIISTYAHLSQLAVAHFICVCQLYSHLLISISLSDTMKGIGGSW